MSENEDEDFQQKIYDSMKKYSVQAMQDLYIYQKACDAIRSSAEITEEEWNSYSEMDDVLNSIDYKAAYERVKIIDNHIPYDYTDFEYAYRIKQREFSEERCKLFLERYLKKVSVEESDKAYIALSKEQDEKIALLRKEYDEDGKKI